MAHASPVRATLVRLAVPTVLALALLPLTANTAWACLCDQLMPKEAARSASVVFTGVALGRVAPQRVGFEERVEFAVETVYKGDIPARWSVGVEATGCGYVFVDGERYTVFSTAAAQTSLCMGNVQGTIDPSSYGVQALKVFASGQLIDFGRTTDRLALAAVLLAATGAVIAMRRRRSRSA